MRKPGEASNVRNLPGLKCNRSERLVSDIGKIVSSSRGPAIAGTPVTVSDVWDVVRRLGVSRALERFSLLEADVHAALAWREGYCAGLRFSGDASSATTQPDST